MNTKMDMQYIPIQKIKPNPLNPRKDYSVNTDEMQEIIRERGWETGITCYKKDDGYIILSGHRRWYAATQLKQKSIPVFIVKRPETELEELERLGSAQAGKVDWTPFEWARFTFNLWILRDRCTYRELALKMGTSEKRIAERIKVLRYFPHHEIESRLENNKINLTTLYDIMEWIERLKRLHMDIVDDLSEDMIRATMVRKAETNRITGAELRADKFLDLAEKQQIITFIRDLRMSLDTANQMIIGKNNDVKQKSRYKQTLSSLEKYQQDISYIDVVREEDAETLLKSLEELERQVHMKKTEISHYITK